MSSIPALGGEFVLMSAHRAMNRTSSPKMEWEALFKKLTPIDWHGVVHVALDAVDESGHRRTDKRARKLGPKEIWTLLGEIDGIKKLELNGRVFVEIAIYLQKLHPEAATAVRELRLQARELEWHVGRLKMAEEEGSLEFHVPTYAQNAAIGYYLMEIRLRSLCQQINLCVFEPLHGSCW